MVSKNAQEHNNREPLIFNYIATKIDDFAICSSLVLLWLLKLGKSLHLQDLFTYGGPKIIHQDFQHPVSLRVWGSLYLIILYFIIRVDNSDVLH